MIHGYPPQPLLEQSVDTVNPYRTNGADKINDRPMQYRTYADIQPLENPRAFHGESLHYGVEQFCNNRNPNPPTPRPIRIVSHNVHNWRNTCPLREPPQPEDLLPGWKLQSIIEKLVSLEPDVICLQEMVPDYSNVKFNSGNLPREGRQNFRSIVDMFAHHRYVYHFISDTHYIRNDPTAVLQNIPYIMLCNGIFSKIPFHNTRAYELTNNRICQVVSIVSQDTCTSIYNVHLEYSNVFELPPHHVVPQMAKRVQVKQLLKVVKTQENDLKTHGQTHNYHIIIGDFNNRIDTVVDGVNLFQELTTSGSMPFAPCEPKIHDSTGARKISGKNQYSIIDHVFRDVRPGNKYNMNSMYQIVGTPMSDHFPIIYDHILSFKDGDPTVYGGKKITKKSKKQRTRKQIN